MIDLASYFGDVTKIGKVAFYTLMASILVVYSLIGLAAPLLRPVCTPEPGATPGDNRGPDSGVEGLQGGREGAPNPSYRPDPCRWRRYDVLLGLNPWEAEACCRVLMSMLMGSIIGMLLPFLLDKLQFDPATASMPLITTIADVSGVLIYFTVASVVLGL